ncbi:MAG: hypothetical protein OQJ96_08055 [Flavobacteriales bacterium]|nr:hypothetical protein [Flavobacteriales bacterium]MCW8912288.1 hypothetical protein [Flavobacteriales bacterium]MCW8937473.1 hypothetical protein [Flavobacteriales bacterium]MCW8940658.1 hypothetical protein [Flavobacteriales bacterium]MCW8968352.1 hypothetical protein [Flavobacteriales bacterium]
MIRIVTILGILFFDLTSQKATACSCVGESTVKGEYKSADIVVTGQIISIETEWFIDSTRIKEMIELGFSADSLDKKLTNYYLKKVLVKVDNIYKGNTTTDTLTIYTGMGGGDCGFRFKEGQSYVIYGDIKSYFGDFNKEQEFPKGQDLYWTNICTRTQEYNRKEIKELEKLKAKNSR